MKEKILIIVPHLSTGGMPQYLLKKILAFQNQFEIFVVEYNNFGKFDVQKKKIIEALGVEQDEEGKKQNRTDETKDGRKKKPRTIEKSKHGRQENIRHEGHTTNRTEEQKKKGEQKRRKEGRNERWDHLVSFQTFDPLEMLYTPKDS